MNFRNIFAFLGLSFAISGGAFFFARQLELEDMFSIGMLIVLTIVQLWGPGIAAIVVQKWLKKGSMKELGYRSGRLDVKWLLGSAVAPLLVLMGTIAVIFVAGNVLGFESFGRVDLAAGAAYISQVFEHWNNNSFIVENLYLAWNEGYELFFLFAQDGKWGNFLQLFLIFTLAGATFLVPFMLGEELGFRGLLLKETQSLGFLGSGLVVGVAWGVWALIPFMMIGYWDLPIMMVGLGGCIALSYVLSFLSLKTGSLFASAAFRGILSLYGGLLGFFVISGEGHISGVTGVAGSLFMMFLTYLILINGKEFVAKFSELSYLPEEKEGEGS